MTIPLVSYGQCIACVSSMSDNYSFGILWTMYCLSFFDVLWLLLWYLVANVLPVFLRCLMTITLVSCGQCIACLSSMSYDDYFGILWPMYCLAFFDVLWLFLWYLVDNVLPVFLRCLMTIPLVSSHVSYVDRVVKLSEKKRKPTCKQTYIIVFVQKSSINKKIWLV
jgi:hypothetical protein